MRMRTGAKSGGEIGCFSRESPLSEQVIKRAKMMVGGEPTDTERKIQRKSLLTLDQQNSCSDIFVSISGLIGTNSYAPLSCPLAYLSLAPLTLKALGRPHWPLSWQRR